MFRYQGSCAGLTNTLDLLLSQIKIVLKADIVVLYTMDQTSKQPTLHLIIGLNNSTGIKDQTQSWKGLVWRVIKKRDVVTLNNIWLEQSSLVRRNFFLREGVITYIGIPISTNGKLLGVVEVYFRREFNPDQKWYRTFRQVIQGIIPLLDGH